MTHHRRRLQRLLVTAVGLIALLAASPLHAQNLRETVHLETLENGLDILVVPDASVPIVTIELTVKNGAYTETPELNGLSHLYEHMFFKGNAVIPNQEAYLQRIRELGIVFNGTTSSERVNYFFTLPEENLEEGLEFMFNATLSPLFDETEFEAEKQVVLGEADRAESNPYYWLSKAMNEALWYAHPARKDPLGARDTVLAATIEQMEWMKEHYYVPNNSVIMVAGDVDPERAVEAVRTYFGNWEASADPFETYPVPEHPPLQGTEIVLVKQEVQVPVVQLAWHGPSVTEDPQATYAADVLSYIVSQPTSQFQRNLVENRLALGASLSYWTQAHTGPIYLSIQTTPDRVRDAIRATLEEIDRLRDPEYYTDEQIESAKTRLAVQDIFSRERTSELAHTITYWWAIAGIDYYFDYLPNLQAVTREDIARYVDDYIDEENFVLGLIASSAHLEALELTEDELRALIEEIQAERQEGGAQ